MAFWDIDLNLFKLPNVLVNQDTWYILVREESQVPTDGMIDDV